MAAGGSYLAANVELALNKEKILFCQPRTLTLNADNYVNIFEKELAKLKEGEQDWADVPIEFVLLWGLEATFPCS
jgi:hypothetical protein